MGSCRGQHEVMVSEKSGLKRGVVLHQGGQPSAVISDGL